MLYRSNRGYNQKFFTGDDSKSYFSEFFKKMSSEVEQMSDEEIAACNFE